MAGEPEGSPNIVGTSWTVDSVTLNGEDALARSDVTIDFNPDGTFGGSDGCNLYSGGQYEQAGETLSFKVAIISLTERPCNEETAQFAERLFEALTGSHVISVESDILTLTRSDGSTVRLVEQGVEGVGSDDGGAAGGTQPVPQPLDGTQWMLIGYGPDASTQPKGELTLTFAGAQMSGSAGCNTFSTPYEVDGDQLVIAGNFAVTEMACADNELNDQERALLDALAAVGSFTRESNTLMLSYDGGILQYIAMETDATELENQTWTLSTMFIGGDAAVSPVAGSTITMTTQDGRLTGETGCNQYFTDYSIDGTQLILGVVGSTRRACPEGLGDQEQQFLELLRSVNGYRLEGPQLTLLADGTPALLFTVPEIMP